jgi:protein-S-isoprenylcysteine O-methyltransferase Ste14
MSTRLLEFRPPRIAMFLVAVAVLLHWAVPLRIELFRNAVLGSSLIAAGFSMMMAGWWLFTKDRTAICPTGTPSRLVVRGIYRLTRSPMYLGIFGMLLGLALIVGSLPFYTAAIVYFIVMDTVFCPYEEEKLLRLFGNEYLGYKERVRRWL